MAWASSNTQFRVSASAGIFAISRLFVPGQTIGDAKDWLAVGLSLAGVTRFDKTIRFDNAVYVAGVSAPDAAGLWLAVQWGNRSDGARDGKVAVVRLSTAGKLGSSHKLKNVQDCICQLALRRDGELTLFSIPLNNANQSSIAALVDRILLGVEDRLPDTEAAQLLSQQLRLDQLAPILNEARHVFVVADGALRRLPSHLLPVGEDRLGAHVPSSTLPSTWTFALRRQVASEPLRSRSVMAAGDPTLHFVNCRDFPELSLPADQLHRDVLCLGMPGGLSDLLNDAQALLGGPTPLLRDAATRTALEGPAPETAGILLFGTHGVVPDPTGGEVPGLDEPALVLTPNKRDSAQDGLLRASDIAQMSWDNAWLAILAACRTGRPSDNELS
ncbi:MAG: hypothetical protein CVV17_10095, partial [Gammaproteobacteria bacterium HGW-Gammaproteobacteria-7]